MVHVPEKIDLDGVLLRRWTPDDAGPLVTAVLESFEHLHPWMPWAAEPPTLALQREYIDGAVQRWNDGTAFEYGLFDQGGDTLVGTVGLHGRIGPGGWEIGYWLHADHTGRGLMTTTVAALTGLALGLPGTERVEIHCDEANGPSAAVPRRLGYHLAETRDHPPQAPGETGRRMIWIMHRDA